MPPVAGPRMGGPLSFWIATLENCTGLLKQLVKKLEGLPLEKIIQPHPISGPMDVRQRFQFLRFHIDRHKKQVDDLMNHHDFFIFHQIML